MSLSQILVVRFRGCLLMSKEGFKLFGAASRLRFLHQYLCLGMWLAFHRISILTHASQLQLQVKFGSSSSEDHQFIRGIPVYSISQVLDKIICGGNGPSRLINGVRRPMPLVRILEVELYPTLLSKARSFGLSDDWVKVCFLSLANFFLVVSWAK